MSKLGRNKTENLGETKNFAQTFIQWLKDEKTKKKLVKTIGYIAAVALLLGTGFFTGRKTIHTEPNTVTVYLPGEPVEIQVDNPVPVYIKAPADTANIIADCIKSGKFADLFPVTVKDSIVYVSKEDTAAVLRDWATERFYEQKVFEIDTIGTAIVKAKAQYNRITWISSTFNPVVKHTTVTQIVAKKYAPFVGVGITTMPEVLVNGGMYFDDKYGASLVYEYNWQIDKHAIGLMGTFKF